MKGMLTCSAWILLAVSASSADAGKSMITTTQPTSQPGSQPSTTTSRPTVSKDVEIILDRLEKKRKEIKDLQADLKHELLQIVAEDKSTKIGFVRFKAATAQTRAAAMVHFHTLICDEGTEDELRFRQKEWWCFDGRWVREVNERTETVIDREVVGPDKEIDPFEIGGPFPVPFGQKKEEILKNFTVCLVEPTKEERGKTDHLQLVPLKGSKLVGDYKSIDFWVDRKLNLPIKIVACGRHKDVTTVQFSNVKINPGLKDSDLWIKKPKKYAYEKVPLGR